MRDRDSAGSEDATQPWAALSRYLGRMFQRLGVRSHDAEDLAQESLARVVRSSDGPRPPPSIALVMTVGRNIWRDRLRRKIRRGSSEAIEATDALPGFGANPADLAADRDDIRKLEDALAALDPRHRQAIVLVVLEHKTYAQAARILGVPRGTVKSRIHYGILRLRARLNAPDRGPDADGGGPSC